MRRFFIGANDTIMFRSSRPFNKSPQNNTAEFGKITPRPFFGMLRSILLLSICNKKDIPIFDLNNLTEDNFPNSLKDIKKLLEDIGHPYISKNSIPDISIKGVFLYNRKNEELFPIPKGLRKIYFNNGNKSFFDNTIPKREISKKLILEYNEELKFDKNSVQNLMLSSAVKDSEEIDGSFITKSGIIKYLSGDSNKISKNEIISYNQMPYQMEWQIGIQINKETYTAEEGKLYRTQKLRFKEDIQKNQGFVIWYDNELIEKYFKLIQKSENQDRRKIFTGKLGGENKSIYLKEIESINIKNQFSYDKIFDLIEKNNRFLIYLATPAIFIHENKIDWKPSLDTIESITGIGKENILFCGGLLDKPLLIGGFNTIEKNPLPLRRMVPAGSVYFYKYDNGSIDRSIEWPINISNYEYTNKEGFGLSFIGG